MAIRAVLTLNGKEYEVQQYEQSFTSQPTHTKATP